MSSTHWHEIPFVRICIPFIVGILVQQGFGGYYPLSLGLALSLLISVLYFITGRYHNINRYLRTSILFALVFSTGAFVRKSVEPSSVAVQQLASYQSLIQTRVSTIQKTEYGYRAKLRIISPVTANRPLYTIAYLREDVPAIMPCDTLLFAGNLEVIPSPGNRFAFDAGRFYQRQGIHVRTYLDSAGIVAHHSYNGFHLLRKSAAVREKVKSIFQTYVHDKQSCAVLLAMTIGIVDGLDDSIYDAYAKSGAIHVLSISGLHIGIVSSLLFMLVGRVRSLDSLKTKVCRTFIVLGGIWMFAFIAGLSPSITRAALMSSVYLAGMILGRPVKGLNVLAFTAFVCLCADPLQINSVSFQFSYLALCGLMIFFRPLYRLVAVKSPIAKFVWGTVVMSLAAQLLLLPMLIHYFNQVSTISILSGLIAIPASYGILIGGVVLLLLHFIVPAVAQVIGYGLDIGIAWVNHSINMMSNIPFSHFSDVYLPPIEVLIISSVISLFALRIMTYRKYFTHTALAGIIAFMMLHIGALSQSKHNQLLAIYPADESLAMDFVNGRECMTSFDAHSMTKYKAKEVSSFRNKTRVRNSDITHTAAMDTGQIRVLDLSEQSAVDTSVRGYRIAVLIDKGNVLPESELLKLDADWIVLSSGLSYSMRRSAIAFCTEHKQPFHDLREHGTFYLAKLLNKKTHETQWQNISG